VKREIKIKKKRYFSSLKTPEKRTKKTKINKKLLKTKKETEEREREREKEREEKKSKTET